MSKDRNPDSRSALTGSDGSTRTADSSTPLKNFQTSNTVDPGNANASASGAAGAAGSLSLFFAFDKGAAQDIVHDDAAATAAREPETKGQRNEHISANGSALEYTAGLGPGPDAAADATARPEPGFAQPLPVAPEPGDKVNATAATGQGYLQARNSQPPELELAAGPTDPADPNGVSASLTSASQIILPADTGPETQPNLYAVSTISDSNAAADTLTEAATAGTAVGVVALAVDADGADIVTYTVDDSRFSVDPDGTVRVAAGAGFDYETEASIDILITATSSDGSSSSQTFTLAVTDINEAAVSAISDSDAAANNVDENAAIGTSVGITAFASDADGTNNAVTYSLSDNAGGRFAIDAVTGEVTVAGTLDRETAASHTITITASSSDGSTSTKSFVVALNDIDEFDISALTDSNASANTLTEAATAGTAVGIVAHASDADATNSATSYSVDDARFSVDINGTVRVAAGASFDYETETSIDINVTATSQDGSSSSQIFTLAVTDINEAAVSAISDSNAAANKVNENAAIGTSVGITAFASDADGTATVAYSLSDDAGGRFVIDATTGEVTVAGALDRETAASYGIEVTATSSDGSTSVQGYTIALNDIDEFDVSPVTDSNMSPNTLTEAATAGTSVGVVAHAGDADATNSAISYSVDDARFVIDANGTVRVAAGASFDHETEASIDINVTATSQDGSSSSQIFTLAVTDINEAAVSAISDSNAAANNVDENAAIGTSVGITAFASDADGTNNAVTYSLSNSAGGRFAIDAVTGEVTVAGALDRETAASHSITVKATSSDGSTSERSYSIALNDIDEFDVSPVTDSNMSANTLTEAATTGTAVGIVAHASDADATNSAISYSVDDARFSVDANGTVRVASGASFDHETETSIDINVTATSQDGSSSSQTFTLAVTDINEAAVSAISDSNGAANNVDENAAIGASVGITAFASDADGTNNAVTYSLSNSAGGRFAIDAVTGEVTVAAALDRETAASHSITVKATSSDGSTSTKSFAIALNDVDEFDVSPVTDSNMSANTLTEAATAGTAVGVVAHASDADATNSAISYSVDDSRFSVDANGTVRVAAGASFDYETETSIDINVTATSQDGSSSSQTFSLAVTDINETSISAISDSHVASNSVDENAAIGTSVGITAFAVDNDGTATVAYSLTNDAGGRFAIDAATGEVTVAGALDREAAASYGIEVTATSSDGSMSVKSFVIALNDIDEFDVSPVTDTDAAINILAENASAGKKVGVVASATDGDATDTVGYSVNDSRFSVDPDGSVRVATGASFDYETETSIDIVVTATSSDGSSSNQIFTLAVTDINESSVSAISDSNAAANSVDENAVIGTSVGITAFATDADGTATVAYSLSNDAGGRFAIDATTGEVTVASALDRETAASYGIEVIATSSDGSTSERSYTIALNDVDEFDVSLVTDSDASANTLAENASAGKKVGVMAHASDADATNSGISYSVDDSRFSVDANGTVRVAAGTSFDYETEASIDINVTATSSDGSSSSHTFTLAVTDISEAAVSDLSDSNSAANNVDENAAIGTSVGITALAMDNDQTDTVTYALSDDAGGRFAINAATGEVTVAGALDRETAASYGITVTATSSDGSTSERSYTIALNDVDEFDISPVTDNDAAANTLSETASVGTAVGIVAHASDADATNSAISYSVDDARFSVDANGTVRVAAGASFDFATEASIDINVTATSQDGSSSSQMFTLAVTDIDETPTSAISAISDSNAGANSIDESAAIGTSVGITAFASDSDGTATITYSLSNDAGGRFAIDSSTGEVAVAGALDRETAASYGIEITATSSDGSTSVQGYTIAINDIDEFDISPVTDSDATINILAENATAGKKVGVVASATDADATTSAITYSVDDTRFSVDQDGTVRVTTGASFDYETEASIEIVITATSSDGSSSSQTFTLAVTDINESSVSAISDSNGAANSVNENAAIGTSVGITAFAIDNDGTATVAYSLSNDAGGRFAIDATTGEVTVAGALDRETAASYGIEVTATSSDGSTSERSYTIALNDVDEFDVSPVTDSDASANTLAENASAGKKVGVVAHASDADATNSAISYSVDDARFNVDANGTVRVAAGASFDHETEASIDILVTAASSDGSSSSQTFTLAVTDINEAAVSDISDSNAAANSVDEDAAIGTSVGITAFASDADGTATIAYSLSNDAGGRFAIDAANGEVTVAGLLDRETSASHSITVKATSSDGSTSERSYTITLNDIDEFDVSPVTDSNMSPNTLTEAATAGTSVGVVAHAGDADATNSAISYSVDDARFVIDANGTVRVAAGASFDHETEASIDINVTATSQDGSSSSQIFSLAVTDINEAAVSAISDSNAAANSVDENAAIGTSVGITAFASDADGTATVAYSLSDDAGGRFAIDAATGEVTVAGALDRETSANYSIAVKATSSDGSTSTKSFAVALNDIDEFDISPLTDSNPSANTLTEAATAGTAVGIVAHASDADATNSAISYSVDDSRFSVDANGTVRVAAGASFDYETETSIDINVTATSQDGSSSSQIFTLAVTDINEAAVSAISDSNAAANNVDENAAIGTSVGITAFASDADGTNNAVTYSLSNSAGGRFAIDAVTGEVTVAGALDRETAASHSITVKATSSDGSTSERSYSIALNDIDEFDVSPVTDSNMSANTLTEAATTGTAVGIVAHASDADATNSAISYSVDDARFSVDANGTVRVASGASFDHETEASIDILVTAASSDGSSSSQAFTLSVTNIVDEAPTDITFSGGTVKETVASGGNIGSAFDPSGSTVAVLSTTDADGDIDSFTYVITSDASGKFEIIGNEVRVMDGQTVDYETTQSHDIAIQVTDAGGETYSKTITINVLDHEGSYTAGDGGETIIGTSEEDILSGGAGDDYIWAGAGDDLLVGGTGNDLLEGEAGNDIFLYAAGDGSDTVHGGAGWTDTIELHGMDGAVIIDGLTVTGQGWTMELDAGSSIDSHAGETLNFSADTHGSITFDDGSIMTFTDIEKVTW